MTAASELPSTFNKAAPTVDKEDVPRCPVCEGTDRTWLAAGYDYEIETCRDRWDFWSCDRCACVWLDPRPAVSDLSVIYPATYYAYDMEQKLSPIALKGKEMLDRMKFSGILSKLKREPRSYLDIGCGGGRYLELFHRRGIPKSSIYGLELSEQTIAALKQRGYQAFYRRVEDCVEIPDRSIDLATMFHVIEHVADPAAVVRRIRDWLTDDGCLVLETPNINSVDARLFKSTFWGGYHIPRHWTLFNEESLRRLLQDAGFEVLGISYQTGHSFWMYSVHHWLKYKLSMPGLAKWFDPMQGLVFLIMFTGLDTVRRLLGFRTSAMLAVARKR